MLRILVINGPNMNLLGSRNPEVYGRQTLKDIEDICLSYAVRKACSLGFYQSNHEGCLIDALHAANSAYDGVILNAGGYAHTSIALRDAVEAIAPPTVEVHLSNVERREPFRQVCLIKPVCVGFISGLGSEGYLRAMDLLLEAIDR